MRTIKNLGIVTAMALALIAFAGAGAASANNFKAAVEPETWNGSLSGEKHSMMIGGEYSASFYCTGVGFSGETKTKTLSSLTVSPSLSGCAHGGGSGSWKMNGCKFRFNPGPGPALVGTMDIAGCVEPMLYEIVGTPCRVEIGNQNGLGKVEYQNILVGGVPSVKIIAKLTGIKYTQDELVCTGSPKGTFSNGTYSGDWIVKGATIPGGAAAGVEIQSTALSYTRFSAEEEAATISGVAGLGGSGTKMFNFLSGASSNGEIYCSGTTYSGAIAAATEVVSLAPSFHGCSIFYPATSKEIAIPDKDITAGGCSYQLNAKGGFGIVGAGCAASPITITVPGCVYKVGPQGGFPGPTFQNEGAGTLRKVLVINNLETKGLTYTAEGASCAFKGTIAGAAPKPAATLSAKTAGGAAQGFWVQ